jgi:hypothetical protein
MEKPWGESAKSFSEGPGTILKKVSGYYFFESNLVYTENLPFTDMDIRSHLKRMRSS